MTKRERIEDLGRILEKTETLMEESIWEMVASKHHHEHFMEFYKNPENDYERLSELFDSLKSAKYQLDDIMELAHGEYADD